MALNDFSTQVRLSSHPPHAISRPAFRIAGIGGLLLPPIAGALIGAAVNQPSHVEAPSLPRVPAVVDAAATPHRLSGIADQLDEAIAAYAKVYDGHAQAADGADKFQTARAEAADLVSKARAKQSEGRGAEALADLAAARTSAQPLYDMAEAAEPSNAISSERAAAIGVGLGAGATVFTAPVSVPGLLWTGMAVGDLLGGLVGRAGAKTSRRLLTRDQTDEALTWLHERGTQLQPRGMGFDDRMPASGDLSMQLEGDVTARYQPRKSDYNGDGSLNRSRVARHVSRLAHPGVPVGNDTWLRHQTLDADLEGRFYLEHREGRDVGNGRREVQVGPLTLNYPAQVG